MRAVAVDNIACPETDIMRHGAEVHARGAADPMTYVFYLVRAGFRCRRRVSPRPIGRSIGNQIDPGASLLTKTWRNAVQTLGCNSIIRIVSGPISRHGLDIRGMPSGAGIIISPSFCPMIEFSRSEFDAKVGREC
jgi:hypothetical protein